MAKVHIFSIRSKFFSFRFDLFPEVVTYSMQYKRFVVIILKHSAREVMGNSIEDEPQKSYNVPLLV